MQTFAHIGNYDCRAIKHDKLTPSFFNNLKHTLAHTHTHTIRAFITRASHYTYI